MNRRTFLTTSGLAAVGFGLGGCAVRRPPPGQPVRGPIALAAVNAAWDRVIRTTVGLRPHRDSGFVLKADKLDDHLLIHNYGHGSARPTAFRGSTTTRCRTTCRRRRRAPRIART